MVETKGFGSTTIRDASDRQYEIVRRLSAGGMATVYLGRLCSAHGFSRLVALKSMHPHYAMDANFSAMFVDEARLTALLRHPNIVSTLDVVSTDESLLLVMEYIEGSTLHALSERATASGATIPLPVGCAIVHDLLAGLHHAHEARDEQNRPLGIIHRDVSPQNLMVGRDGLARVLDFGIAKARGTLHESDGVIRGKVPYMPPEQLCGKALDRRADVYATGVVLWEVLTGQRLFEGEHGALVSRIMNGEVATPSTICRDVSPELDAVVMRALARDPEARFPTALAMAEALARAATLANRGELARWASGEATLASADRVPEQARFAMDSIAPSTAEAGARPSPWRARAVSRNASVALFFVLVTTLGVFVGSWRGPSLTREAHATTAAAIPRLPRAASTPEAQPDAVALAPAPLPAMPTTVPLRTARSESRVVGSTSRPVVGPARRFASKARFDPDLGF